MSAEEDGDVGVRPLNDAFATPNPIVQIARYGAPRHTIRAVASPIDAALNEKLEALGYVE